MKKVLILPFLLIALIACETDTTGTRLIFKGVKKFSRTKVAQVNYANAETLEATGEPAVHKMYTKEVFFNIAEVWVSKDEVQAGLVDDFEWILVGKEKNKLQKISDFSIQNKDMPPGEYNSMKIVFRNEYKRLAEGYDNAKIKIEIHSAVTGGEADNKESVINYFSKNGSFNLSDKDSFHLMSEGENMSGFEVLEGKTSIIEWMSGLPGMDAKDISFDWHDNNGDGKWDAGDKTKNFVVDPKYDGIDIPMFSFNVVVQ